MKNYKRVYFRINTPSYYKNKYGVGFENEITRDIFYNHVTELFLNDGWKLKGLRRYDECPSVVKDKQELYLHPQSFSGVVLERNIEYIEQLVSNSDLFKFEKIDVYEDVFNLTDNEYLDVLKLKQVEIEEDILENYKTKRKNLYITNTYSPLKNVLNKYRIKRLQHYIGVYSSDDIDWKFITGVFDKLIAENKIVTESTKNGIGYRTVNKAE